MFARQRAAAASAAEVATRRCTGAASAPAQRSELGDAQARPRQPARPWQRSFPTGWAQARPRQPLGDVQARGLGSGAAFAKELPTWRRAGAGSAAELPHQATLRAEPAQPWQRSFRLGDAQARATSAAELSTRQRVGPASATDVALAVERPTRRRTDAALAAEAPDEATHTCGLGSRRGAALAAEPPTRRRNTGASATSAALAAEPPTRRHNTGASATGPALAAEALD